jgi:hypothetical protein
MISHTGINYGNDFIGDRFIKIGKKKKKGTRKGQVRKTARRAYEK